MVGIVNISDGKISFGLPIKAPIQKDLPPKSLLQILNQLIPTAHSLIITNQTINNKNIHLSQRQLKILNNYRFGQNELGRFVMNKGLLLVGLLQMGIAGGQQRYYLAVGFGFTQLQVARDGRLAFVGEVHLRIRWGCY